MFFLGLGWTRVLAFPEAVRMVSTIRYNIQSDLYGICEYDSPLLGKFLDAFQGEFEISGVHSEEEYFLWTHPLVLYSAVSRNVPCGVEYRILWDRGRLNSNDPTIQFPTGATKV